MQCLCDWICQRVFRLARLACDIAPIPGPCTLAWQGVTVPQYASQMVERYLHHEYDQDRRMNLEIAAREMYGEWLGQRAECAGGIAA